MKSASDVIRADLDYICDSLKSEMKALSGNAILIGRHDHQERIRPQRQERL